MKSQMQANNAGFLLVEALIALFILSIALVAAMGGLSAAVRVAGRGEDVTKSILEKERVLFDYEMDPIKGIYPD